MPEKIMRVKWDEGANLSQSRKEPGDYSPLTRDADTKQLGQVTLSDIDEDEASSSPVYVFVNQEVEGDGLAEAVSALIGLGVIVAVAAKAASPHVKHWLNDSARPAMKASRKRVSRAIRRGRRSKDTEIAVVVEPVTTAASDEVAAVADTAAVRMSSAEWEERFRLMLLAGGFQAEQWRLLSTARIDDGGDLVELQKAMDDLSPQQLAEGIRLALDANDSLLDAETSAAMRKILTGIRVDDGTHALPSGDQQSGRDRQ